VTDTDLPEHVRANREYWDARARHWVVAGARLWSLAEPVWGQWEVPDAEVRLLPDDMTGTAAIELGCGTGYVSAWMTRRGAMVTAIDNSEQQLAIARRLARDHGLDVTWLHGNAETVPRPDASFDHAVSEYGASIWCDPRVWVREAHRLLRPGGTMAFLGTHPLAAVCAPLDGSVTVHTLVRPWFDLHRLDWRAVPVDPGGVEFTLPTSGWFRLFDEIGFDVVDYREPRPAASRGDTPFSVPGVWARDYPSEQVWKVRKRDRTPAQV
jgi:SAM-dependent methyltransferase